MARHSLSGHGSNGGGSPQRPNAKTGGKIISNSGLGGTSNAAGGLSNTAAGEISSPGGSSTANGGSGTNNSSTAGGGGGGGGGGSARSRMRARMQQSRGSNNNNNDNDTSYSSNKSYSSQTSKQRDDISFNSQTSSSSKSPLRPNNTTLRPHPLPDIIDFDLDSETINNEVNIALSELKLDAGLDVMDFAFENSSFGTSSTRSQSNGAGGSFGYCGGSVGSPGAGKGSGSVAGGGGSVGSAGDGGSSGMGCKGSFGSSFDNSPTAAASGAGNNKFKSNNSAIPHQQQQQHQSSQSQPTPISSINKNMKRTGTYGSGRQSPGGHTVSTKSMTATLTTSSARQSNINSNSTAISPVISVEQYSESSSLTDDIGSNHSAKVGVGATNMFKDASAGSTFHKSKKIVRPGESIPEHSTLKRSTTPPSSPSSSQQEKERTAPSPTTRKNSVKNSPFHQNNLRSTAIANRLPPSSPKHTSKSINNSINDNDKCSSPFAVKLRKTGIKDTIDAPSTPIIEDDQDVVVSPSQNNPFLAQIKLRKTTPPTSCSSSAGNSPSRAAVQNNDVVAEVSNEKETVDTTPPKKKKLTYREQQELLRQQQQQEEEENNKSNNAEEEDDDDQPITKDVATLIRERIAAANKNAENSMARQSSDTSGASKASGGSASSWKDNLKKTSHTVTAHTSAANASSSTTSAETTASKDNAKSALNSMLLKQRGVPQPRPQVVKKEEAKEVAQDADPRGALMAMLNKRANPPSASASKPAVDNGDDEEQQSDPRNALSAMLLKKQGGGGGASPVAPSVKNESRSQPPQSSDGRPALKNDPKYEKYFKMLKVGMPLPAVQHAMTRDGLDASIMDEDHNLPAPMPQPEESSGVPLKQDPMYEKYFKMLKLGLPMGAVKNAMERDGLDSRVMDGNHSLPANSSSSNNNKSSSASSKSISKKPRQKDTHRRTRLHWDTLDVEQQTNSNSVWALVEEDTESNQIEIDEKEFTTLFQAEIKQSNVSAGGAGGAGGNGGSNKNVVQVIDPKRANNGGIILARLRMSYDDMAQAVDRM